MEAMLPMVRKMIGVVSLGMTVIGGLLMLVGWILMFPKSTFMTGGILFNGGSYAFLPGFIYLAYWSIHTKEKSDGNA